ncbi:MAG: PKD domain-containing protein [Chitinophagales bacterium]
MKKLSLVTWAVLLLCFSSTVNAQLALTNASTSQTIDFSSSISGVSNGAYTAAGFQSSPSAGQLNSNAWAVTGWSDGALSFGGTQTTASTDYTRGATNAAQTVGGFYAATMTPHSAANPGFLIQPGGSDFSPGTLTLKIVNNGTTNITQLDVSYKIYVRNDQGRSTSFNFSHSSDNSTYTAVAALDYTSPTTADVAGYVLVGTKSTSITGLAIAPSSVYYIRWSSADVGGTGSRDEIGLDDISVTGTFSAAATPASDVSAATGGEPTSISSIINTQGAASSNFNFTVTDDAVGDDALPTLISQIVIAQGTGNDIADWTQAIAGAELSDGTNTQTGTVAATSITFSGINTLLLGNISDGASKTFTLKVWLKTSLGGTLPTTVDGLNLAFKVQGSSFTTVAVTSTGMSSPGTTVESGSSNNAVDVTATALNFTTAFAPTSINVFTNFTTPGVVRAQDANGNTDLGVTSSVTVTNSAGYSTINNPGSFSAGVLTFPSNFQFGTGGGSTTVTVDDANAGTTNATSGSITVTVPTPTLATSVLIPNFICPGSTVSVPYTATNFGTGNVFTAQLSDASGSFASPVSIGTLTSTASGTISATIPSSTANGTGYRIRVVGSAPSFTGTDNGQNITIQYSNSTPLFTESMGTVSTTTLIASHEAANGFDNDGFTMSGSGDIRSTGGSSGAYTGASGGANVFLTNTAGTNFRIDGINTSGLSPMVLYMGIFKSTTGETGSNLQLEVSSNGGTSWTTIPWTTLAGTLPNTATWNQVKVTGALPQSATLSLRFTNLSNTVSFRLDDINVYSGTPTTFSVSPTGPITQCGGTVALTASPSGQTYSWSTTETTQSISVGSTGSYTVTIADAFGCSAAKGPVSVTINTATLPSIKITSTNSTICAGVAQSFSVGATTDGGVSPTYQWKLNGTNVAVGTTYSPASLSPNDVVNCYMNSSANCITQTTVMSNTFTVRPTITGTTATVFTENFGSSGTNIDFSVYTSATNPTLAFSGLGDVRNSTSSTGYTGSSGNSNAFLTQNGSSPIGEKNLVISNINTTNAFPNKLTFGMNKSTNADNGNDLLVEYSLDGISYFSVGTVTVPTGTGTGGTNWSLVTFDNALPYATNLRLRFRNVTPTTVQYRVDDVTLIKYNTFTASITPTGPTTFCSGGSVTLNAAPTGLTYLWSNAATANNISVNASGTYAVSITDGVGCKSSASQAVTVNALPTLSPTASPATICNGESSTLAANATAGSGTITTYAWSTGLAGNVSGGSVSPSTGTTYVVTVTNSNNCSASGNTSVAVNAIPTLSPSASPATICDGGSSTLAANATAGSGTISSYTWSTGLGNVSGGSVSPSSTTTYNVTVTNSNNCSAGSSITVNVNAIPTLSPSASPAAICNGGSSTLAANATAGSGTISTYAWSTGLAGNVSGGSVSPSTGTTYVVTVTNSNNCSASGNTTVAVNAIPTLSPSASPATVCAGSSSTLAANATAGSGTISSYTWSTGLGNVSGGSVSPSSTTTYNVTVTNSNSCTASSSTAVSVNAVPVVAPSASPSTICNGSSTTLNANATAGSGSITTYAWSSGIAGNAASGTVSPTGTTTYDVTVTNSNSCTATDGVVVTVNTCGVNTWLGNTTQWLNAGNWSSGFAPTTCSHDALIPTSPVGGLFPTIGLASIQVGNLTVQDGATITVNNNSLSVCGNLDGGTSSNAVITGNANGSLILNGSSNQQVSGKLQVNTLRLNNAAGADLQSGASVDVMTAVELQSGNLNTTGATLRFRSTSASQIAVLDDFSSGFGGSISGPITAQRAYDAAAYQDAHYFGSPVDGPTAGNLGSANGSGGFVTAMGNCDETQLANNSLYGNVYTYDETNGASCNVAGWKVEGIGSPLIPAKGYSVRKVGAGTLVLSGTAHTDPAYLQTGTNSNWSNVSLQGRPTVSGWTMVSNPYLATLDLTTAPNPGGYDVVHAVWNATGPFAGTYTDEDIIAPFQAFFVRRKTTGSPAYLIMKNNLTRSSSTTFQQQNNAETMTLYVTNTANGLKDKTTVGFNTDATSQYDGQLDAYKMPGALTRHTLYSYNSNPQEWLMRNYNTSIAQTSTVNVGFEPGVNGNYSMNFDGLQSFDPTSYITLEDKKTGTFHDVRSGDYSFSSTTADNWNRFVLHFTPAAKVNTTNASCAAQGQISIEQPGSANWNYTVTNSNSVVISSGSLNQSNPVTVSATPGVYTVTLTDANNYTVVKNLQITGASPIAATMTASANTAETGEDINFTSTTANAATTEWNFGDNTTATTASASHNYTNEGSYNVTLTVSNADGCSSTTSQMVTVTAKTATGITDLTNNKLNIWSNANRVYVDFNKQKVSEATIDIYNVLGQKVSSEKWGASSIYSRELNNLEAGYLIVSVKTNEGITTKKVLISSIK